VPDRDDVVEAIRACWSEETSSSDGEWTIENPAKGQCDVSSFVAWDYLGGDLVLAKVFVDGEQVEHHYWNRIDGFDLDLTREQYSDDEEIVEHAVLQDEFLLTNQRSMKPDVMARIEIMRGAVTERLGPSGR
jgi:hypothetical protein